MFKQDKKEVVAAFKNELKDANVVLLLEHGSLPFAAFDKARRNAKEGTKILKIKNNLAKFAFEGTNYSALNEHLEKERLIIMSDDLFKACQSAKFFMDYAKDSVKIKLGASDKETYAADTILALSSISSKEELQSKLLRAIKVVAENMLRVINAKFESKES